MKERKPDVVIEHRRVLLDDFFRIEEAVLRHPLPDGGTSASVRRLMLERGDSAAALLFDRDEGALVLTRQFRWAAHTRGYGRLLELPAGAIELDEAPEAAIRRELLEEVGYRAGDLRPIATIFPSPGTSSERIFLFWGSVAATDRVARGGGLASEGEDIEVVHVGRREAESLLREGEISDGKTVTALEWMLLAHERGELELGGSDG